MSLTIFLGDGELDVELGRPDARQLPEEAVVDAVGAVGRIDRQKRRKRRSRRNVEPEELHRASHRKTHLQVGREVKKTFDIEQLLLKLSLE